MVSAGNVGGTRGSGMVSSTADVLWMSVRCVGLAQGGVGGEGGEWIRRLSLDITNPVGTGGVFDVCLCFGCGGGEWV